MLYAEKIEAFLSKNKYLAWGIIPTSEENISFENPKSLYEKLIKKQKELASKGVNRDNIINKTIITPTGGTGSLSAEAANKVIGLLKEVSILYKYKPRR